MRMSSEDNVAKLIVYTDTSIIATNTVQESGSGNGLSDDKKATDAVNFAAGSGLLDLIKVIDKGMDEYKFNASGTTTEDRSGAITATEQHDDKDDGVEDVIATDTGVEQVNQTNPDGSTLKESDTSGDTSAPQI